MSEVNNLQINPVTLSNFPEQIVNNWDRKVEIETAYMTSVSTTTDGSEFRKGLKVRPRRFISARLTAMDQRDCSKLSTFIKRLANEAVTVPIYSDVVEVLDFQGNVFVGDFSNTRFFVGGRVLRASYDYEGVVAVAYHTIEAISDTFLAVTTDIDPLAGSLQVLFPTIDSEIELDSLSPRSAHRQQVSGRHQRQ